LGRLIGEFGLPTFLWWGRPLVRPGGLWFPHPKLLGFFKERLDFLLIGFGREVGNFLRFKNFGGFFFGNPQKF